ncbi:hypothetical protein SAMN05216308_104209 [Nitrosospira sp. Nsp13]|nr:hypothetical protein SAMN05216308_104209 [Nitrosospira sp. Nsp13]
MEKVVESLIYYFQDRFKPLRDNQKRAGAFEAEDGMLTEERYSGTVSARTDDFEREDRTTLIKTTHVPAWRAWRTRTWRATCMPSMRHRGTRPCARSA